MMKKMIVAMVLMLGFQMSQAQTLGGLFQEFGNEEDAVCLKVPWLPMRLVGLLVDDEAKPIIKRISSVRVLEMSDCSSEVQERFATKMKRMKMKDYEPLLTVKEDDSHVKMWGKMNDESISELVIGVYGDGEAVLCAIKGRLSMDDLKHIMESK